MMRYVRIRMREEPELLVVFIKTRRLIGFGGTLTFDVNERRTILCFWSRVTSHRSSQMYEMSCSEREEILANTSMSKVIIKRLPFKSCLCSMCIKNNFVLLFVLI